MIIPLNAGQPIVNESGLMTQPMRTVMSQISKESLIKSTGSPEGVVVADIGQEYMDLNGIAGNIKYIKRDASDGAGDLSIGWILV